MKHALPIVLLVVLVGCGSTPVTTPMLSASPTGPVRAQSGDVRGFRVVLGLPSSTWRASEEIAGTASLERLGDGSEISGSGAGPFGFEYREVGGRRHMEPIWTADCGPRELTAAAPIQQPLSKSSGLSDDDPDAAFYRDFLQGPGVRLPVGEWDISAVAWFHDGPGCTAPTRNIRVTIRVTITA